MLIDADGPRARQLGDLRLERGRTVSGRVLDPSGKPVAGVELSCKWSEEEPRTFTNPCSGQSGTASRHDGTRLASGTVVAKTAREERYATIRPDGTWSITLLPAPGTVEISGWKGEARAFEGGVSQTVLVDLVVEPER